MNKIYFILALSLSSMVFSQKFACFKNDKDPTLQISVKFDKNENPISVKYLGQSQEISLKFKKKTIDNSYRIPIVLKTYDEIINGKKNGTYEFSNAGSHGLDVTYTKKDKKQFYFEVIAEMGNQQEYDIFRKDKCF